MGKHPVCCRRGFDGIQLDARFIADLCTRDAFADDQSQSSHENGGACAGALTLASFANALGLARGYRDAEKMMVMAGALRDHATKGNPKVVSFGADLRRKQWLCYSSALILDNPKMADYGR
jgi:hypothetical protein